MQNDSVKCKNHPDLCRDAKILHFDIYILILA